MKKLSAILMMFAFAISLRAQDTVATLAGQVLVSGAANGTGTNAAFNDPAAIVADTNGNFFVADSQNDAVRKITANGVVTTFAGQLGVAGSANGTGTGAQFNSPSGLAFDKNGNLFASDTGNSTIREITAAGVVSTFAGIAGSSGFADGAAGGAQFNSPLGIAVAPDGTIYIADSGNHCIRVISGGVVSTFAGSPGIWGSADGIGTNAQFNGPVGLAFDSRTNLFVSDANNDTIRKIASDGTVTTFAPQPASAAASLRTSKASREVSRCDPCAFNTTGQPAASPDAVSPPGTEKAKGKLLEPKTAIGPTGNSIRRRSGPGPIGVSPAWSTVASR